MRIVIDLQGAQTISRFRGIGRYATSLALAIARNAGEHEIWLVLNAAFPESIDDVRLAFREQVPAERIRIFKVPSPLAECDPANAWRVRAAEKVREHFIRELQPDFVLITSLFEGISDDAVTSIGQFMQTNDTGAILYDLIPYRNPAVYLPTPLHRQHYGRKVDALRNAALLFAISEFSRQDAIDALGLKPDHVVNIMAAIDPRFTQRDYTADEAAIFRARFGIQRNMVMVAPGGFDTRKNIEGLIQAYSLLPPNLRASHQLVIVSKIDDPNRTRLMKLATAAGLAEDDLVLTGYVNDDDLVTFYNLAALFVFPSKYEGFGLPVLEAMACGAPTIGSNNTSIPEVIGLAEAMFDPGFPHTIADKMEQVLSDDALRERLRQHGLEHAKDFSWDISAQRTIAAIEAWHAKLPASEKQRDVQLQPPTVASLLQSIALEPDTGRLPSDADLAAVAEAIAFNTGGEVARQLLLDISEIVRHDAKSGIQRVVRSILFELLNNAPPDYEVCPIYYDGSHYRHAKAFVARFLGHAEPAGTDDIAEFNQGDVYLALDLHAHLTPVLHPFHMQLQRLGVHVHFVVYDILLVRRPDWWREGISRIFEEWLRSITQVATGLVCISEAVADDVRQWMAANQLDRAVLPPVSSFHLGADVENSMPTKGIPETAATVFDAMRARPSFLMVGTLEPRKGHAQALAAFELLWAKGTDANLVIVGKHGWLVDALLERMRHHPELGKRLVWLEGVSDEYLERVYAAGTCLIAASEGEGFGLPLIEAAQHEVPIIARDIPVFREVAGEHAFYFSGLDAASLADSIETWLELNGKGLVPSSADMPWLTWRQSAQQLLSRVLPAAQPS
jgi:glycosyltransferase involved in cell wall biosynthesis